MLNTVLKISVVIPTADRPAMLVASVTSALAQSLQPFEVLVVDNGRSAVDQSILPETVRVLRTPPRIGPGKARNHGAQEARGDVIAFLDDDDLWQGDYLEKVAQRFLELEADVVVGQLMRRLPDDTLQAYKLMPDSAAGQRSVFYSNPGVVGSNFNIKRQLFLDFAGFDETMPSSEDRDLLARLLIAGKRLASQPQAIAISCDHAGERAHHNIVTGNWLFIRKHWRAMRAGELYRACRALLRRVVLVRFGRYLPRSS
ncbi:MAG TPA: glycosyltransferase family 2 protein [Eoetvoesiella sp.]